MPRMNGIEGGEGLLYHYDAPEYQQAGGTNRGTRRRKRTAKCTNGDDDELNAVHTATAKRTKPQISVSTTALASSLNHVDAALVPNLLGKPAKDYHSQHNTSASRGLERLIDGIG